MIPSAYTPAEIDAYLEFVRVPADLRRAPPTPELLKILHVHQLCSLPFEDLDIHYGPHHGVNIDPRYVYDKFMAGRGRGGYCMEQGLFFCNILRGLGFHAYPTGARVRPRVNGEPAGPYMGLVHCVVIVAFDDGSKWLTDVGYGGEGPITALPLVHGAVTPNLGCQETRVAHAPIPELGDQTQKYWIYQVRNSPDREFGSCYSFIDAEHIPEDFEVMNYYTSTHPKSYMTNTALVVKFLHHDFNVHGKRMLVNSEVRENSSGRTEVVATCNTEAERIVVLEEKFGLALTEEEQRAIHDTKFALSPP